MDFVEEIIEYENGNINNNDAIGLFSKLVKSGMAWTLQGHYGRTAQNLISTGILDKNGNIIGG